MTIEIRGHSVHDHPASLVQVSVAFLTDLALALLLRSILSLVFLFSPIPLSDRSELPVWLGLAGLWGFLSLLLRATPGMKLHRVRRTPQGWAKPSGSSFWRVLLLPSIVLASWVSLWLGHPLLASIQSRSIDARLPTSPHAWMISPFYYALGGWPKSFRGKPVLVELGYAKGIPRRFIPEVRMTWESPSLVLRLDGPKTPSGVSVTELKRCFLPGSSGFLCPGIRSRAIGSTLKEMRQSSLFSQWRIFWFQVMHPDLPEEARPQGIWIEARGSSQEEIQAFLLSPNGALQGISLKSSQGGIPPDARILFQEIIAGLKLEPSLDSGKAWINRELQRTELNALSKVPLRELARFIEQLTEIQLQLVSKISVDPGSIDAYFHLGGVSILLLQRLREMEKLEPGSTLAAHSSRSAAARRLVWAAAEYAKDVDLKNPMTRKLEEQWEEAKRY